MSRSVTITEIESYSNDVRQNKISCGLPPCHLCATLPSFFRRHEARSRTFYLLSDELVQSIRGLVIRWRCPGCKKTFTQQPPFALACKRYVREIVLQFSGSYLEDDAATYRSTVLEEGMPIFHASAAGEDTINETTLAHSTPYRWITALGSMKKILRCGQNMVMQKNPSSTICRDLASLAVAPKKYMKALREPILKRCRQLLHLEAGYRVTFSVSIFPFFATRCAWQ